MCKKSRKLLIKIATGSYNELHHLQNKLDKWLQHILIKIILFYENNTFGIKASNIFIT